MFLQVEAVNERTHSFNLNVLPFNGGIMDPPEEDVNVQRLVDSIIGETDNVERSAELVKPATDAPSNPDQELNFPINDTLLVGGTVSNPVPPPALSFVAASTLSEVAAPIATSPVQTFSEVDTKERTLLKELEEMGFKQVDLNKEILRRNAYDLEQSVDELCDVQKELLRTNEDMEQSVDELSGISDEWDTILVELQEMVRKSM